MLHTYIKIRNIYSNYIFISPHCILIPALSKLLSFLFLMWGLCPVLWQDWQVQHSTQAYLGSFLLVRDWPQYADIRTWLCPAKGRGGDVSRWVGKLALKEPVSCWHKQVWQRRRGRGKSHVYRGQAGGERQRQGKRGRERKIVKWISTYCTYKMTQGSIVSMMGTWRRQKQFTEIQWELWKREMRQ